MQLIRHLPPTSDQPTAVAIGNFDGLHLGHQAVVAAMIAAAKTANAVPSVLTFEPHPRRFFAPNEPAFRLERLGTKLQRLQAASVARVYMPRFDASFASMQAEAFLDKVLARQLGARVVVTGENFAFGQARRGDVTMLQRWGAEKGIEIVTVPRVMVQGHACSSSAVRMALGQGDMAQCARLLGRVYALTGTIIHGAGRGADFGFATANIALPPMLKLPRFGVYAVRAQLQGRLYDGVANIGLRPTVNADTTPLLEVHLFDLKSEHYGAKLDVQFLAHLRDERKFDGIDSLIAQIGQDCAAAKALLASMPVRQ